MCETIVNLDIVVPNQTLSAFVGAIAEQLAKELDVRRRRATPSLSTSILR
jgi:hypothetical protein